MLREILFFSIFAVAFCQYPLQRAPPHRHAPPPEEYDMPPEEYARPPPPAFRPDPRKQDVYRPASVHYVNIGLELAGDYKFGYDTGKGNDGQSFREETRLPDGTVQGAYGYIDETGRQRIVKYTAGKDGFKAEGDVGPEGAPKAAPARAPQPQPRPAPQPAYVPQPQPRPAPASAPRPAYIPQPAPRPQPAPAPRPQPMYRQPPSPPQQEQAAYRPPPQQPSYRPEPQAYAPRPRPQTSRPRPAPKPEPSYDYSSDYEDPNNDITERRLMPVDTSLFNYNIGTSHNE